MNDTLPGRLGSLKPSGASLDRDGMLFAAGRASVKPRRIWPALAGLFAITQCVSLVLLLNGPRTRDVEVVVDSTPRPGTPTVESLPAPSIYVKALRTADPEALPPIIAVPAVLPDEPIWTIKSISSVVID